MQDHICMFYMCTRKRFLGYLYILFPVRHTNDSIWLRTCRCFPKFRVTVIYVYIHITLSLLPEYTPPRYNVCLHVRRFLLNYMFSFMHILLYTPVKRVYLPIYPIVFQNFYAEYLYLDTC